MCVWWRGMKDKVCVVRGMKDNVCVVERDEG